MFEAVHCGQLPGHRIGWRRVVRRTGRANRFCQPLLLKWRQDGDEEGWISLSTQAYQNKEQESLKRQSLECRELTAWWALRRDLGQKVRTSYHCIGSVLLPRPTPLLIHSLSTVSGPKLSRVGILTCVSRLHSLVYPCSTKLSVL